MYFFDVFGLHAGVQNNLTFYENGYVTSCTKRNYLLDNYASFHLVIHYCGRAGILNPSFLEIVPYPQFRPVVIRLFPKLTVLTSRDKKACSQTKFQIGNWRIEQLRSNREASVM